MRPGDHRGAIGEARMVVLTGVALLLIALAMLALVGLISHNER